MRVRHAVGERLVGFVVADFADQLEGVAAGLGAINKPFDRAHHAHRQVAQGDEVLVRTEHDAGGREGGGRVGLQSVAILHHNLVLVGQYAAEADRRQ